MSSIAISLFQGSLRGVVSYFRIPETQHRGRNSAHTASQADGALLHHLVLRVVRGVVPIVSTCIFLDTEFFPFQNFHPRRRGNTPRTTRKNASEVGFTMGIALLFETQIVYPKQASTSLSSSFPRRMRKLHSFSLSIICRVEGRCLLRFIAFFFQHYPQHF